MDDHVSGADDPASIWDDARLADALADAACLNGDLEKRAAAAAAIKAALDHGRATVEAAFHRGRPSGVETAEALSDVAERAVRAAFRFARDHLSRRRATTTSDALAIAAVGGFGRGWMAPFSDVDLLFLTPYKPTDWTESVIENTLYLLWDLKLKVGHATRSVSECVRLAGQDVTIRTSLLERRLIDGAEALYDELDQRLWSELFDGTGPEFVEAKLAERDERHRRTGGSRYLLEPNVKESKGGQRDLQTLFWIAKYLYRADSLAELTDKRVFTEEEAARWRNAESFLWRVRCGLHYAAGRPQEKLTFDYQVELAERFGYRDAAGQRAVERFMKRYFVAAKQVGDLTRIFCAALEDQHQKKPTLIGGLRRLLPSFSSAPSDGDAIGGWLTVRNGRIAAQDPEIYATDPTSTLRLVREALDRKLLIHPGDLRLMHRERRRIDDAVRADPEARALLVSLIADPHDPVRALRRLAETGVLGRMIPEFGRVVGLMQFNMYHHYTVDEHTLLTLDVLTRLGSGELRDAHPIETEIVEALDDRRVLATALLFHDIGKGLPEDHSIAGERIARAACPALGLSEAETDQIAWLVRHHLAMSDVAQKRDIADPATVRGFADLVQSPTRLRLLYALTACDIRAVGPGVWNNWKAQLLRDLYKETRALLVDEASGMSFVDRVAQAKLALRDRLRATERPWSDLAIDAHVDRFFPSYWAGLSADTHVLHAEMSREHAETGDPAEIMLRDAQSRARQATKIAILTADHPGLFARMAGAFALVGASVLDARAYTTRDGVAINTFWVQDDDGGRFVDAADLDALRRSVRRTLKGEVVARDALRQRRKLKPRERPFDVAPRVVIDNAASDVFTLIEVNGRDRVGLVHDLARAIASQNVNIFSAIISTYGERAVDVFYVKDLFGMKIDSADKRRRVEAALLEAIERSGDGSLPQ